MVRISQGQIIRAVLYMINCKHLTGGMQDYNYVYQGTYELTLELSCCKYPPESEIEGLWSQNREALIAYLQAVHMGKIILFC